MGKLAPVAVGVVLVVVASAVAFSVGRSISGPPPLPVVHEAATDTSADAACRGKCCEHGCSSGKAAAISGPDTEALLTRLESSNLTCACRGEVPTGQALASCAGCEHASDGVAGQGMGMGCGKVLRAAIEDGRIHAELVESLLSGPTGDVEQGRQLFAAHCASCHRLHDQGADIAPDLTNRPRHNPIYVLANLSHPSAVVPSDYQAYVVTSADGRTVTGLKTDETEDSITICDATNQRHVIPRADIDNLQLSTSSLMPDNLVQTLGEEQLRHLLAFLGS